IGYWPVLALAASVAFLRSATIIKGQGVEVSDKFDSYNNPGDDLAGGWNHYDPGTGGGQTNSWTFPSDGSGGKGYRLYGPASACENLINRGGSYRSEQYAEFFESVDVINFDANAFGSLFAMGSRIGPPAPSAPGELTGYISGTTVGSPLARQAFVANIEFTAEIVSTVL